jgi:UPF0716 protein FxsA
MIYVSSGMRPGCRSLAWLLALAVLVPLAEVAVLVAAGRRIGVWPTVALVIAAGALGVFLARAEGLRVVRAIRRDLDAGVVPATGLLDGLLVLAAALLLILPGLLTDVAGLLLLLPPVRRLVRGWLAAIVLRLILGGRGRGR